MIGSHQTSAMREGSWFVALIAAVAISACGGSAKPGVPSITVYKSATCGCCRQWAEHLRDAGFDVDARNVENLNPIKERVGVPAGHGSCHTAEVAGYFVEGHVPADDVKRLLAERPDAKGLAVPGMPVGSPGMETPSGEVKPYDVLLVARDGSTTVFAHHEQEAPK